MPNVPVLHHSLFHLLACDQLQAQCESGIIHEDIMNSVRLLFRLGGSLFAFLSLQWCDDEHLQLTIDISTADEPASNIQFDYDFPGTGFIDIQPSTSYPCIIPYLCGFPDVDLVLQGPNPPN